MDSVVAGRGGRGVGGAAARGAPPAAGRAARAAQVSVLYIYTIHLYMYIIKAKELLLNEVIP